MRSLLILGALVGALLAILNAQSAAARGSAATNLSNTDDDSRNPTLAVGAGGVRHVVWEEKEQTGITYLLHRTFNGVSWSPTITVGTGTRPAVTVGPDNTAHLVWTDEFSGTLQVFYSQWGGAAWAPPKLAAPGLNGNAAAPAVVVGADNIVRVAWGEFQNTGFKVYYAQSASGGSGAWLYGPVPSSAGTAPSLALDAGARVHLAWQQPVGGARDVLYAAFDGTTWSTPENISQSPSSDSISPAIVLTSDGRPLVTWSEQQGVQFDIMSSNRGIGWSIPVNVSRSTGDSLRPRLARAPTTLYLAWNEAGTPASIAFAFGDSGAWTAPLALSNGAGDWSNPALAGAQDGRMHFAYDGGASANGDIFYDSLGLLRTFLPLSSR